MPEMRSDLPETIQAVPAGTFLQAVSGVTQSDETASEATLYAEALRAAKERRRAYSRQVVEETYQKLQARRDADQITLKVTRDMALERGWPAEYARLMLSLAAGGHFVG